MILDRTAFRSFQRARLLHVAVAGLLTITMVLGQKPRRTRQKRRKNKRADSDSDSGYYHKLERQCKKRSKQIGGKLAKRFLEWCFNINKNDVYHFDEDGVPRSQHEVLFHPLLHELGSISEWLEQKNKRKVIRNGSNGSRLNLNLEMAFRPLIPLIPREAHCCGSLKRKFISLQETTGKPFEMTLCVTVLVK